MIIFYSVPLWCNLFTACDRSRITQVTEDEQIEIMKTKLQTSGQLTGLSGKPYDFYKQIDVTDFLKYLKERYSDHTA